LTNEVEEMKVLLHMLNLCIIRSSGQYNIWWV
jgi:hypothetical protein